MFSETLIKVEGLAKTYHIYALPHDRLKQFLYPKMQRMLSLPVEQYFKKFSALSDINFSVKRGETLGIIGRNGSGKSTLLQIICGTLEKTQGSVITCGRIAALLELGSGFNIEFTGRENIYMYSMILGLTKEEIDSRFEEIILFADIGDFIDEPIKMYSSGMVARLAFSVAVQIKPDILVVDEALSVGDMAFQEKSFTKMKEIRDSGTTILFVSHSLPAIRNFCDKVLWLDNGVIRAYGSSQEICELYQKEVDARVKLELQKRKPPTLNSGDAIVVQDKTISISSVHADKRSYKMGENLLIEINLEFHKPAPKYGVGLIIYNLNGQIISLLNTLRDDIYYSEPFEFIGLRLKNNHFSPGEYFVTVIISDDEAMFPYDKSEYCLSFEIEPEISKRGLPRVEGILRCEHEWI